MMSAYLQIQSLRSSLEAKSTPTSTEVPRGINRRDVLESIIQFNNYMARQESRKGANETMMCIQFCQFLFFADLTIRCASSN